MYADGTLVRRIWKPVEATKMVYGNLGPERESLRYADVVSAYQSLMCRSTPRQNTAACIHAQFSCSLCCQLGPNRHESRASRVHVSRRAISSPIIRLILRKAHAQSGCFDVLDRESG